ncbi:response regulator [Paludifilum halophilum]|uniref:Transcriptional regulatory protein n=1 Tax=Paludifilum halophilum TaxID=1642702 RepID=A0A235B6A6_9BACL|nr:response regulator [Paludifilum halophilum]OYD07772.1 DNA-binding response regulator [Paludifilum halophilum]
MIHVAIAEDDFRVAAIHEEFLLKVEGVRVAGKARNAEETLELLEQQSVDLLLLDIYLPDELGTDLLPKIRTRHPDVDLIMITAGTDKALLQESIRSGVFHYLIKPVTVDRFIETIKNYIRKKQLLEGREKLDQSVVDDYFAKTQPEFAEKQALPKGIDPLTLKKVKNILRSTEGGMAAEEIGEQMGASRTTARRYLEYLVSIGEGNAELEYGIVGRPERKYRLS